MDDVDDEEEEERGVDRSDTNDGWRRRYLSLVGVVVTTDSTAVGSEAAANTAESGEKKDLEEVVREMDDRMKGTAKMLLGNLVRKRWTRQRLVGRDCQGSHYLHICWRIAASR